MALAAPSQTVIGQGGVTRGRSCGRQSLLTSGLASGLSRGDAWLPIGRPVGECFGVIACKDGRRGRGMRLIAGLEQLELMTKRPGRESPFILEVNYKRGTCARRRVLNA